MGPALLMASLLLAAALTGTASEHSLLLQDRVDAAAPGEQLTLEPATYAGPVRLNKSLKISPEMYASNGPHVVIDAGGDADAAVTVDAPGGMVTLTSVHVANAPIGVNVTAGTLFARNLGFEDVALGYYVAEGATILLSNERSGYPPEREVDGDGRVIHGQVITFLVKDERGDGVLDARVDLLDANNRVVASWTTPSAAVPAFVPRPDAPGTEAWRFRVHAPEREPAKVMVPDAWAHALANPGAWYEITLPAEAPGDGSGLIPSNPALTLLMTFAGAGAVGIGGHRFLRDEWRRWRALALAAPLYTRLTHRALLDHPTREAILSHVRKHPGTSYRELQRALRLPNGVLAHHLVKLTDAGLVRATRHGYRVRYALTEAGKPRTLADTGARVAAFVHERPGTSAGDVARGLGIRPSLVTYHVSRLEAQGVLARKREGARVRLVPVE